MSLLKRNTKETLRNYLFIFPLVSIIIIFLGWPIIKTMIMSFQYWYMPRPSSKGNYFIFLENYKELFGDRHFYNSVFITMRYVFFTVILRFLIGFIVALLLNHSFKGRSITRALVIIPWAIPEVVAVLIWILMSDKDYGPINYMLKNFHLISENIGYLQNTTYALIIAMILNIWKGFPFVSIMILAGLQNIPKEIYEAGYIDGTNFFQKLWYITIPLIRPVVKIIFLLLIIWTIKDFAIIYVLAQGGPSRATEILTIYVYQTAFKNFDFGKASAAGMIMLLFSLLFSYLYFKLLNKEGDIV